MDRRAQVDKAVRFLALHHGPRMLLLPNIWDPLGARILAASGYPAVATASAAVAYSLGKDDGERIGFDAMLAAVSRIAASVEVPLSADIESGYAQDLEALTENVRRVLRAGAVGINLEDSEREGRECRPIAVQCERIRAARRAAELEGIPLVLNARIDTFLSDSAAPRERKVAQAIERGKAYVASGADCLYPIGPGDVETVGAIREATGAPVNVYAHEGTASLADLQAAGIRRVSLGPNLLKAAYTTVRTVARRLQDDGSYEPFTRDVMSTDEIRRFVDGDRENLPR